jgi:hypothetical protein
MCRTRGKSVGGLRLEVGGNPREVEAEESWRFEAGREEREAGGWKVEVRGKKKG